MEDDELEYSQSAEPRVENRQLPEPEMVAESAVMLEVIAKLRKAAAIQDFSVLLTGETGVGKKEAALFLHRTSQAIHRHGGEFVEVNCSAIPETLLESELFGHEKGAFTGAIDRRIGQLELSDRGSLLLDEIGDSSPKVQQRLLKFLEDGQVRRVGAAKPGYIKTRVISATHKNLEEEIRSGRFREDLFYRLNVFPIRIPPLAEREDEIEPLVVKCIRKFNQEHRTSVPAHVDQGIVKMLQHRSWRGNIRELFNAVEQAIVNRGGRGKLQLGDFHLAAVPAKSDTMSARLGWNAPDVKDSIPIDEVEKRYIEGMFKLHDGNKRATAAALGIYRPTLYRKLVEYGLFVPSYEAEKDGDSPEDE